MSKLIELTQGRLATVDNEDFERVNKYTWQVNPAGYAMTDVYTPSTGYRSKDHKATKVSMHRMVMGEPEDMEVDHINHDTLDNRQSNLRIVTHAQNMANMKTHRDSKTGVKGVYIHRSGLARPYRARITFYGNVIDLGLYATVEEASTAYNDMAKQLNGELAYQQVS